MFDVYWGDTNLAVLTLVLSVAVALPVQLLLCFKVKSRAIRLLPAVLLVILIVVFLILAVSIPDLGAVGYVFLAIYAGFMLFMCGLGWGIWAFITSRNRRTG